MGMKANLLAEISLEAGVNMETSANTGADSMTLAHMRNGMECVRSRQTPKADVNAGYQHSLALGMTIQALHAGKRVIFDEARQEILAG